MADNQVASVNLLAVNGNNISVQHSSVKENLMKPEKVKSRWRRNSEMETEESNSDSSLKTAITSNSVNEDFGEKIDLPAFENLEENLYLFERKKTKQKKEVRRMLCECTVKPNEVGCGDECLNRLLMIECGSRCATGELCSNKRFQKRLYAKTELFKTEKKGLGLKVIEDVPKGSFIIEYCGEVLNSSQFKQRVKQYAKEKVEHYYFMALKIDEIIDARFKANVSRYINHSCDPNCETQKWTVNGELRIGFFAKRAIKAGEELTFDYQFERYGREAQTCFCGSSKCKGYIGVSDEITVDIANKKEKNSKRKKSAEKDDKYSPRRERDVFEDLMSKEEIEKLSVNGLRTKDETLMLARLMVRAEDSHSREKILDIILGTTEVACLRLFLDYHGLSLFFTWMACLTDFKLKKKILKALSLLPVPNKNMLLDSKILSIIEKWVTSVPGVSEIKSSSFDEKEEGNKSKSCDTSDSETDGGASGVLPSGETSSSKEVLTFSSSKSDETLISKCDFNTPKTVNSTEKSLENISSNTEEFYSDSKASDPSNPRSDEDSADTVDDESTKDSSYTNPPEISELANNLLANWRDLKETFRIPRREKGNEKVSDGTPSDSSKNNETKEKNIKKSDKMEEKAEPIKVVVYRNYTKPVSFPKEPVAFPIEQRSRFNRRPPRENNRIKEHTARYDYEYSGSTGYSNNDNQSPGYSNNDNRSPRYSNNDNRNHGYSNNDNRNHGYSNNDNRNHGYSNNDNRSHGYSNNDNRSHGYSNNDNRSHKYSSNFVERNNLHHSHYVPPKMENTFNRPALFETPSTVPRISPNISPNIICGSSSKSEIVTAPPFLRTHPNIVCGTLHEPPVTTTFPSPNIVYGIPEPAAPVPSVLTTPNIICGNQNDPIVTSTPVLNTHPFCPAESPVTLPPPALPNVMFPPPSKLSFIGASQIVPSVSPETTSAITSCQSNNTFSQPHLVPIPAVNSSAMPIEVNTSSAESVGFTHNKFYNERPVTFAEPSLPLAFPTSQGLENEEAYSSLEVNGEPPKAAEIKLPPNWKTATDEEGNIYYYNVITRESFWDPPDLNESMDIDSTPTDESKEKEHKHETHSRRSRKKHSKRKSTTTAPADTSSSRESINEEIAKKIRELFRTKMSNFVVSCLNPYRKDRIRSNDDFKHLARKLTHFVMAKELKHCKNVEDLEVNDSVKLKAKDFIRKYMDRYGSVYRKEKSVSLGTSGEYIDKSFSSKT